MGKMVKRLKSRNIFGIFFRLRKWKSLMKEGDVAKDKMLANSFQDQKPLIGR